MATYAVLGSTGQVGGSIIEVLLHDSEKRIHACARSKQKLLSMRPTLSSSPNVAIFEGTLRDTDTLTDCITGTNAVFLAAAASDNIPGCTVAQEQARAVIEALKNLRKRDPQARLPQLVVLSSSSLEPHLVENIPPIGRWVLHTAASHVYADLRLAEQFLRSHDWVKMVFVKPGGLSHDKPRGHVFSTERQQTFLSFLDLAAGMVELADSADDRWDMKNVSVNPASPGTAVEWRIPYFALKGITWHFLPFLYPHLSPWLP
ncbi:hypothetical protein LTR37_020247 [Vermiconidia calcicola]|uniref:Uncharacterized protein n=1 Tax=Vermiconidia calcicola TaxID=1690605 RepID=A0ACC3MEX5_9PEZI|nr:hypothetical protein LTR37_020247 [Vermiconidia calcicola]